MVEKDTHFRHFDFNNYGIRIHLYLFIDHELIHPLVTGKHGQMLVIK
jgi:hypothetical protein